MDGKGYSSASLCRIVAMRIIISGYKPESEDWTHGSNKQIALAAERAGFDFLFPVSRWRGFGGKIDYMGRSQETMTWAAALLAQTKKVRIFSTVHVPVFHPLVVAKMGATIDHISGGPWGSILSVDGMPMISM